MNGIAVPQMGTGLPFKLTTNATIDGDKISFADIAGHAADNEFSGALTVDRKAEKTTATGELALSKADATWLGEAVYGPMTDAATGDLSAGALGLPIFKDLDVNLKLSAKQFWPGWSGAISDFTSNVAYRGDELQLNDIKGGWDGGSVNGSLLFTNADGTGFFQTQLVLADADLAGVVWPRDGAPVANGKFGLGLSMEASGKSMKDIAGSLNGSGELRLGDISVRGLNLGMLAPLLAATDPMQDQLNAGKVHPIVETLLNNGEAKLPPTAIPFNVTDGVLRFQNVSVTTDQAKLVGNGQIDLPQERINASLNIALNPGGEVLPGAEPAVRLDFSGLLASPGRTIDVTDITGFLSLRAYERERRRVERLQSNVLEKQRLRREVALYKFNDIERQKAAAFEAQRQAEEQRLRALAAQAERDRQAAEAKAKADAEAEARAKAKAAEDAKAAAEAARRAQEQLTVPPENSLNFETVPGLPGVQVPQ
jgi:hypothetical protein